MKKIFLLFSFVTILSFISTAQQYRSFAELMIERHMLNVITSKDNNEYEGSPYDQDEFITGRAISRSDVIYENLPLRLNIYNDDMEYQDENGKVFAIGDPGFFNYFEMGDLKIQHLPFMVGNKVKSSYFKVIEEGEASLLLKPKVNFHEAEKPGAYSEAKPATFKRMADEIFIKLKNEAAVEITNKKSLIAALSDKEEQISDYIKKNKIKTSNPDDVLEVVKYYNSN